MTDYKINSKTGLLTWESVAHLSDADALRYFGEVLGKENPAAALRFIRNHKDYQKITPGSHPYPPHGTAGVGVDRATAQAAAPAPTTAPQAATPRPAAPATIPAPTAASGDPMAALAAVLAPGIMAAMQQQIEEATQAAVAAINAAAVAPTVTVKINDLPARKVEGTTHTAFPKALALVGAGLHVLLSGPAGCGKTSIALDIARAFQKPVTVIACSAGMTEAQLFGRLLPLGDNGQFQYVPSPLVTAITSGHTTLIDEIDALDPNLAVALNALLANGFVEIEARAASKLPVRVDCHPDTRIIAAANTWGSGATAQYVGRNALDAATLDRFYPMFVDYCPTVESVSGPAHIVQRVQRIRALATQSKLRRVVSTRMITKAARAIAAGISEAEVFGDLLAPWSADERAKVGE